MSYFYCTEPSEDFIEEKTIIVYVPQTYDVSLEIKNDTVALEPDEEFTLSLVYNDTFTLDTTNISIVDDDSKYAMQNLHMYAVRITLCNFIAMFYEPFLQYMCLRCEF